MQLDSILHLLTDDDLNYLDHVAATGASMAGQSNVRLDPREKPTLATWALELGYREGVAVAKAITERKPNHPAATPPTPKISPGPPPSKSTPNK